MIHECSQIEEIAMLKRALYGDKENNVMGIIEKTDAIYKQVVDVNIIKTFFIRAFFTVSAILGLLYSIININQEINKK